jgi:hypothetical protein
MPAIPPHIHSENVCFATSVLDIAGRRCGGRVLHDWGIWDAEDGCASSVWWWRGVRERERGYEPVQPGDALVGEGCWLQPWFTKGTVEIYHEEEGAGVCLVPCRCADVRDVGDVGRVWRCQCQSDDSSAMKQKSGSVGVVLRTWKHSITEQHNANSLLRFL